MTEDHKLAAVVVDHVTQSVNRGSPDDILAACQLIYDWVKVGKDAELRLACVKQARERRTGEMGPERFLDACATAEKLILGIVDVPKPPKKESKTRSSRASRAA